MAYTDEAIKVIELVSQGEMTPSEAYAELDKLYAKAEGAERREVGMCFEAIKKYEA